MICDASDFQQHPFLIANDAADVFVEFFPQRLGDSVLSVFRAEYDVVGQAGEGAGHVMVRRCRPSGAYEQ